MAITGQGTQEDPWIVHNYEEIKSAYKKTNGNSKLYIKLENDIDCNDYGDTWEWATISPYTSSCDYIFDLNGRTIKNIMIKSENTLFNCNSNSDIIHNGKILNIFNNDGKSIAYGNGLTLKNVSMSINGTGLTGYVFQRACFKNCSVYFKSKKLGNNFLYTNVISNIISAKNCDFYFDIDNVNGKVLFQISSTKDIDSCRFRGKIGGTAASSLLSSTLINNCVVEIDTSNLTNLTSSYKMINGTSVNTIVNTEVSSNLQVSDGTIGCTTAQMRDADYLNSIGFTVVKVGE